MNFSEPPEWLKNDGPDGMPELSDRDAAIMVLPDLDYESQLLAIRGLLAQCSKADEALCDEIKKLEEFAEKTSGIRNKQAADEWVERLHQSVYQDAAISMAAVGLIAPFVESIFYHAYQVIGHHMTEKCPLPTDHQRWLRPAEDQWDCHFVWKNGRRRTDLVKGIMELADAISMTEHLPKDLRLTLEALFAYRNKMFHCGFEWPVEERRRFAARIEESVWPSNWFSKATINREPWVFYMSTSFVDHCVATVEQIISGIGAFCKEQLLSNSS